MAEELADEESQSVDLTDYHSQGLSSLSEEPEWTEIAEATFANIDPTQIILENRAREKYQDLDVLAESMKEKGVIQPLAVQATEDPEKFLLLAGGRRYSAAVLSQIRPLPVRIFPKTISDLDRKEIELFENIHRMDLDWSDKAKLTREIHALKTSQHGIAVSGGTGEEKRGHSLEDTAKLIGYKEKSGVSKDISLANALDNHPELAQAKNASEAKRMLYKITRNAEEARSAEAFEAEESLSNAESVKRRLCNSYARGDFFDLVSDVPDAGCNVIEIDPPYAINLQGIKEAESIITEGYTDIAPEDYPLFLETVFTESYRVLMSSGWVICWFGFQWYPEVRAALERVGFSVCHIPGFWVKPTQGQTRSPETRLAGVVECFLYARKGKEVLRKQGRNNLFLYHPAPPSTKVHPTERPIEMMEDILTTFVVPGGQIMVPFLGSGNTLLAAANVGMRGFGFDLDSDDKYRNAYVNRVVNKKGDKFTSYAETT